MGVLVFIIILAVLVLVHEFGHFIAAKKSGVLVEEFGFGFPPRLFGKKIGETLYSVNLLPIGGFVKLYGEEYHEERGKTDALKSRAFVYKKPWQKTVIIVAGIVGNFLLAWVLISYLFTQGVPTPTNNVSVESVRQGSPAYTAGIRAADEIKSIQTPVKTYPITAADQIITLSHKLGGQKVTLKVLRNGVKKDIVVTPRKNPPAGQGPLGIVVTTFVVKKYPWYQAPFYGLAHSFDISFKIVSELSKTVIQLLSFKKPSVDVAGPIGIAQFTGQAIKFGNNAVLELTALLSLNLAVINILPFPALDGGRLAFVLYEWVSRKRVNKSVERYVNLFGIIILLSLAFVISVHDVIKLVAK